MLSHFTIIISSRPPEISWKLWETWKIFPILHSAPCDNNDLMDLDSNFQVSSWNNLPKLYQFICIECIFYNSVHFAIKSVLIAFLKNYNFFSLLKYIFFLVTFKYSIIWILVFLDNKYYLMIGIWSSNNSFTNFRPLHLFFFALYQHQVGLKLTLHVFFSFLDIDAFDF